MKVIKLLIKSLCVTGLVVVGWSLAILFCASIVSFIIFSLSPYMFVFNLIPEWIMEIRFLIVICFFAALIMSYKIEITD